MSNNVMQFAYFLFYGCISLESIDFLDELTSINSEVFTGTAIKTIDVPNSVTSIGGTKFAGLSEVTVHATIGNFAKLYCNCKMGLRQRRRSDHFRRNLPAACICRAYDILKQN